MQKITFYLLYASVLFLFCRFDKTEKSIYPDVSFTTMELEKSDIDLLSKHNCEPWNKGIAEMFRKVLIMNRIYDTLNIPAYYCIEPNYCPFISYDVVEYCERDSIKVSDILCLGPGYESRLTLNDSLVLYLRVPDKRKKHKYFVTGAFDSLGTKVFVRFPFFD